MNILIPLAGSGTRFANAGYLLPKFLIPVQNRPVLSWVIDSIKIEGHFIFLCRDEHVKQYELPSLFRTLLQPLKCSFEIVSDDGKSPGAAPAILKARHRIDNNQKLMICNNDQCWRWDSVKFLKYLQARKANGAVLTFENDDPKWSYVKTTEDNLITEVVEKVVVSNHANVGVFCYEHGADFCWSVEKMMEDDSKKVKGEWYVAPSINELIAVGQRFYSYKIDEMGALGTPEDMNIFIKKLNNDIYN